MQSDVVITTVRGEPLRAAHVITHLKVRGLFRSAVYEMVERRVVRIRCKEFGIDPPWSDLEENRKKMRSFAGLPEPVAMHRYLKDNGIGMDVWNEYLDDMFFKTALKERIVMDKAVEDYFRHNRNQFLRVRLGRIVCRGRSDLEHVLGLLKTGKEFLVLAGKHSIEEKSKFTGGYLGEIGYGVLAKHVEADVFSAPPGQILGPYKEMEFYTIYKIYEVRGNELSESLAHLIREQIFADWLRREVMSIEA